MPVPAVLVRIVTEAGQPDKLGDSSWRSRGNPPGVTDPRGQTRERRTPEEGEAGRSRLHRAVKAKKSLSLRHARRDAKGDTWRPLELPRPRTAAGLPPERGKRTQAPRG